LLFILNSMQLSIQLIIYIHVLCESSVRNLLQQYWTNCAFGLYPSSGVSKIVFVCHCVFVCIYIGILAPPCMLWSVRAVSLIATWVFPWLLVFQGVCRRVCVCLGLYAILVFPRFLIAVKCAVAGSLIASGVWLASRVYVCMHSGKWLCG
jgi:hypothetical protein